MRTSRPSTTSALSRGVLAGLAGTALMTAFQELVEKPLTRRADSFAPADLVERVTPLTTTTSQGRRRLNWTTHFALGAMWGAAFGVAALDGVRGQKAVHTVFGIVYTGDVLLNTALGLYSPRQWSTKDLVVDVVDKYVQAQGTGLVLDRLLARRPPVGG